MNAVTTMFTSISVLAAMILCTPASNAASAQLEAGCVENSPERQDGVGCTIIERKPLPENLKAPLFWSVERFDSGERARAAVGPASVALEAHGSWWLLTIESKVSAHLGGRHVATIGPLPLPPAPKYSLQVMSATFAPGMASRVHYHSGAEAWYVIRGEQCLETATRVYKTHAGETLVVPAGVTMRLVATGSTLRRALAIIVYDSAQPPTTRIEDSPPPLPTCK